MPPLRSVIELCARRQAFHLAFRYFTQQKKEKHIEIEIEIEIKRVSSSAYME